MGLYRRHKVWWMRFTYRGKQIRKSTETSTRKLAEAILGTVLVKIQEGRYFEVSEERDRTCSELLDRYEAEEIPKKASQRANRGYIKNLRPFFGEFILADTTPKLIVAYRNKRYKTGVKPATINRELSLLKHAFNLAMREWEWCTRNPVASISFDKENNKRDRWLRKEEEPTLLSACPPWLLKIVVFALHTGMRMGEIRSLEWAEVDLFRKTVMVIRSKNGEKRTIPQNVTVLALLKAKMKVRSLQTHLVFHTGNHTIIDDHHLRRAFRTALKKAGIHGFTFHDLRHTFATRLVQAGVDLYRVKELLGHKSIITTQRYAHHYPESLRSSVDVLEECALAQI